MTYRPTVVTLLVASVFLCGCATDGTTGPAASVAENAIKPTLGWRLPKTVLDATVTWTPTACNDTGASPVLTVQVSSTVVARGVPDTDIGANYPGGLVSVPLGDLNSFWIDSNLTYKTYSGRGGLLQSLSSHSTGETGTIIGNFITGVTKIVAAAAAAPGGTPPAANKCGTIRASLQSISDLRAAIASGKSADATKDAAKIQSLKDAMTVTKKVTIEPGVSPYVIKPGGLIATIQPDDSTSVIAAGWYSPGSPAINNPPPDLQVKIWLDLKTAALCPACVDAVKNKTGVARQLLADGALFRQAAYLSTASEQGPWNVDGHGTALGDPQVIAFGQFGKSVALPIKVKSFQDVNWEVDFSDLGEVTQTTFASKATGVAVSNLVSGAATAASTVQSTLATAAAAPDSATVKLQTENTALKAQIDNKTYKTQLEATGTATTASAVPQQ